MLNLYEREQLAAFARYGSLSKVAEASPWSLLPAFSEQFPDKMISSRLAEIPVIPERVKNKSCEIGFWRELCHKKMPVSRFLVQTDEFEFRVLAKTSTLSYFVTNLAQRETLSTSFGLALMMTL